MIQYLRILGIDPGYGRVGIAILEKMGGCERLIHSECFQTDSSLGQAERIFLIARHMGKVINKFNPSQLAIETLLWSKNKKTAMRVAEARGVIIEKAAEAGLLVREFNPNQVKLAVTGYGKSDKKQIISMVEKLLKIGPKKRHDDEYDAIAIALTASATPLSTEKF